MSLLNRDETEHGPVLDDFIAWCYSAHLQLNVAKTKDMTVDFRHNPPPSQTTIIKGQAVEAVWSYKYLGSKIDNKLNFNLNTENISKKGQQRHCLHKMTKFNEDNTILKLFYKSYTESVLTFSMICWYGNLSAKAKAALSKIVKVSGKIIGAQQSSLTDLYNRFVLKKAESILSNYSHHFHSVPFVTFEVTL